MSAKSTAKPGVAELVLFEQYESALDGIDSFSHIIVMFWMHLLEAKERGRLKVHPRRNQDLPLAGVFATRSPARPNPLGVSIVRLLGRDGCMLRVAGLDALEGSPIIDIKPYLPGGDSFPHALVPDWLA